MKESKKEQIKDLLKSETEENQKKILLETAAEYGTEEWRESVLDLMKRMKLIKK